jgi:hypothetical protein
MKDIWQDYWRVERRIKRVALAAGLPPARAAFFAAGLAARPLPRDVTARLLFAYHAQQAANADPTIAAAHHFVLTHDPESAPALHTIHRKALAGNRMASAGRGHIFIDPDSDYFRAAESGNLWPVAALLVHEQYHVQHGASEAGAYAAELAFLQRHGAPLDLIEEIELIRDSVVTHAAL